MTLPVLSIQQPWAWAIAHGGKDVENRTWTRPYRGPIAVHASLPWNKAGAKHPFVQSAWKRATAGTTPLQPDAPGIHRGAILAIADLTDICTAKNHCDCGPWSFAGQNHWRLANVRLLSEPIPCKGTLGLWQLPEDVETRVHAALADDPGAGKTPVEVTQ